jgi:hypothetical protein
MEMIMCEFSLCTKEEAINGIAASSIKITMQTMQTYRRAASIDNDKAAGDKVVTIIGIGLIGVRHAIIKIERFI